MLSGKFSGLFMKEDSSSDERAYSKCNEVSITMIVLWVMRTIRDLFNSAESIRFIASGRLVKSINQRDGIRNCYLLIELPQPTLYSFNKSND